MRSMKTSVWNLSWRYESRSEGCLLPSILSFSSRMSRSNFLINHSASAAVNFTVTVLFFLFTPFHFSGPPSAIGHNPLPTSKRPFRAVDHPRPMPTYPMRGMLLPARFVILLSHDRRVGLELRPPSPHQTGGRETGE